MKIKYIGPVSVREYGVFLGDENLSGIIVTAARESLGYREYPVATLELSLVPMADAGLKVEG